MNRPLRPGDLVAAAQPDGISAFQDAAARGRFGGARPDPFEDAAVWTPILERLGIADEGVRIAERARLNGTSFQAELLAMGDVKEARVYREIAAFLDLRFVAALDPARLLVRPADAVMLLRSRAGRAPVRLEEASGRTSFLLVPEEVDLARLQGLIANAPRLRDQLRVVAPGELRRALQERAAPALAANARNGLYERFPQVSARIVANAWQGIVIGVALAVFVYAITFAPGAAMVAAHGFFSMFFLACVALRFAAVRAPLPPAPTDLLATPPARLPRYTVLVALHRESEIVPQLLAALDRVVWPRSKLEVKLVCEADDRETLAALSVLWLPPHVELIRVPAGHPRTKPKALNYALPLVRSDFVVLYDAEDRPHPLQLVEAFRRFEAGGADLACLQAPLEIANGARGVLPELFAFEYRALFRSLLPFLSGHRVVLPLGGTSNHFRTAPLREVGGWDPYNVTEDADLGIRLVRNGYRVDTMALPTLEDAPETLSAWLPQRTRWFKGWLQTWLVHMRHPLKLASDLGWRSFLVAQILMAGLVISALVHPLLLVALVTLVARVVFLGPASGWPVALMTLDAVNIVCGYLSFLLLGRYAMRPHERGAFWQTVLWTPVYWLLLSAAAWRACFQLLRRPHLWEKTPHFRSRTGLM
jgi:cellulose synthase/poly-beta-1,6-N-acetylglucosamine synthase-like glycosyltransferase